MPSTTDVRRIDIPSATADPAAYVEALLETGEGLDPFAVLPLTPVRVRDLCATLPAGLTAAEPEPSEWSVALITGHLFDVDIVYGFRWRLVLTENGPSYPGYDEGRWANLARLPFWQLLDAWTGLRAANVALLRSVTGKDLERAGRHGEQGGESLDRMVRKVIGHDIAHLNQLYRAARTVSLAAGLDVTALDATYRSFGI